MVIFFLTIISIRNCDSHILKLNKILTKFRTTCVHMLLNILNILNAFSMATILIMEIIQFIINEDHSFNINSL